MTTGMGEAMAFIKAAVLANTDECIEWPFYRTPAGYGRVYFNGSNPSASRVSLILATGSDRPGLEAAHRPNVCHNPSCINPRHLRWATRTENELDRIVDGTSNRGTRQWSARLTEEDVRAIRNDNRMQRVIAADYQISPSYVSELKSGRKWAWLDAEAV